MSINDSVNVKNASFWDELCGSQLAHTLGIRDRSPFSLKKYDDFYFHFYPYLKKYLSFLSLPGKSVCEIGLGYGTVSSYLAQRAQVYYGIDIARGPVEMVNYRLSLAEKPQNACIGSAHELPFDNNSLDNIVSIGCFHHTGSTQKCVNEALRCLKPQGTLLFMCYNRKSFRILKRSPSIFFTTKDPVRLLDNNSALYDINSKEEAAPYTELSSQIYLKEICKNFS